MGIRGWSVCVCSGRVIGLLEMGWGVARVGVQEWSGSVCGGGVVWGMGCGGAV